MYSVYIHQRHLLQLIPRRVEGSDDLGGWLHTELVYLPARRYLHRVRKCSHKLWKSARNTLAFACHE